MLWVAGWIIGCIIVSAIGSSKGRGAEGFFISLILSPLIGILAVIALSPKDKSSKTGYVCRHCGKSIAEDTIECEHCGFIGSDYKHCPDCAEVVREKAKVCRYCGYSFASTEVDNKDET